MPFCLTDEEKKITSRPRYTHIYAFLSVLVCLCAFPCLAVYNVRAYVYVRLNVYKYKIMLISVNSFGYVEIVSYLCNVIKNKALLILIYTIMNKQVSNESVSKSVRMASLRNADQESKTLSGTIKVVKTFWRSGYKEAFSGLVSAADIMGVNAPAILAKCLKDDKGQACTHSRKAEKNPDGSLLLDSNGKRIYVDVYTPVTKWTPRKLLLSLIQEADGK